MRGPDGKLAPEFKNVVLDTHQYLMTAETMGCPQTAEGYDDFVRNTYAPMIAEMSEYFPVIVGSGACSTPSAAVWTPTADKACSTARKARRPRP